MRRPRTRPDIRLLSPLRDFLRTEAAGGVLLAVAAVVALVWANSPWSDAYHRLWETSLAFDLDGHVLRLDLKHWINDALMTIFFLVVGLEITRELHDGHLATARAAAMPVVAAVGGMAVPALLYLAIAGTTEPRGWAVPMATDIALAVGILAVAGPSLPAALRAFLLGLAIVDDIGAIVVIAIVYSSGVSLAWLATAVALVAATIVSRRLGIAYIGVYLALGAGLWFSLHEAGIHATLAGVTMGLLAPTTPRGDPRLVDVEELAGTVDVEVARATSQAARDSVSVVEWLQHVLHPWTSFVIVPLFALANSGIGIDADALRDAVGSPIVWGVIAGLVVGKPVGIALASWIATRSGIADPPTGSTPRERWGIGAAAGIGFTVALFVTDLAFDQATDREHAKLAVLIASVISAAAAAVLLRRRRV